MCFSITADRAFPADSAHAKLSTADRNHCSARLDVRPLRASIKHCVSISSSTLVYVVTIGNLRYCIFRLQYNFRQTLWRTPVLNLLS